ncbi:MAG TPA: hypothetical protein VLB84_18660, partial [Bacteroidia bacterium]|nr:hypothetical protein [Bacteroidia bacterium]
MIKSSLFTKKKTNFFEQDYVDYSIELKTGPVIIQLESTDAIFSRYIKSRYLDFLSDEAKGAATYYVRFYSYQPGLEFKSHETEDFIFGSILFNNIFNYRQHKKNGRLDVILPLSYIDWEIDNILKLYFSGISLNHNVLLIHASAIIKDNKAVLFTGPSGAGKSTISSLSQYEVIHDDIIAISILEDNRFYLRTIPFKIGYKKREFIGEVNGFYRIFQSNITRVEDINKQTQLMHILFSVWNFDTFKALQTISKADIMNYCTSLSMRITVKN